MNDVNNLSDRSREAMRRRIKELDKQNAKTAKELAKILKEQIQLGVNLTRSEVIHAVMECFENLVNRTPVDTGRLRAGWQFTGDVSDIEFKPGKTKDEIKRALRNAVRRSVFQETDALYVFNNVEYLLYLNAGWSRSFAGNFIDLFLQELKDELQDLARAES